MSWSVSDIKLKLPELIDDFNSGEVVLFIGAGFSKMANFPLWEELIKPLATGITHPSLDPIQLAENIVNEKGPSGRHKLNAHIKKELSSNKLHISRAHKIVTSFPLFSVLTLNFDESLEKTFEKYRNLPYQRVIRNRDFPYLKNKDGIPVVKINGCISDVETIIITKSDFKHYASTHHEYVNYIKSLLATNTFLYLGTSFRDPIFAHFNKSVLASLGTHKRPSYLLNIVTNKKQEKELANQGIEVIDLGLSDFTHAEKAATKFLENLYEAVTGSKFIEETPEVNLKRIKDKRLGTGSSLEIIPEYIDETHKYLRLIRKDLLDYKSKDFFSIRQIKVRNISGEDSEYILYCESTELKCAFKHTKVTAYDFRTNKPLRVECCDSMDEMAITHAFRIYFPKPLKPDEEFELVYSIRLPGELSKLKKNDEIMSIALVRIKHGVENLCFNVCLNFKPKDASVEYLNANNRRLSFSGEPISIKRYVPRSRYEKLFDIPWSNAPWIIEWSCNKPLQPAYIIHYKA